MKTARTIMIAGSALAATAADALAATTGRQDDSQFLVWAFLGMCALIVIIQLMPVVMIAFGLVKGLVKGKDTGAPAEVVADK